MPGGDGTGPMGMGPMTGRAAGYCVGYVAPGYANLARSGFGRGRRRMFRQTGMPGWMRFGAAGAPVVEPAAETQVQFLKDQVEFLESQLAAAKARLDTLAGK